MSKFEKILSELVTFLMSFLITVLAFGQNLMNYYGKNTFMLLAGLCFPVAILLYLFSQYSPKRIWDEIVIISVLPMLFVLSSMVFRSDVINYNTTIIYWFYGVFFCTFYIVLQHSVQSVMEFRWTRISGYLVEHKVMILMLIVILLLRLPFLTILPRWDSGEYYYRFSNAVKTFQYTGLSEYVECFALCGHPTLAFSFVYMIGELIAPGHVIGVSLISLGMTVVGLWCIYRILLKICKGVTPVKAAVFTGIISMAPLFYSTNMYFNPDYALAVFFVFVIYSYVYHKPFLTAVSSLLCFQTKETGLILVGGLVFGVIFQHYKNRNQVPFMKGLLTDLRLYCTLTATILQLLYNRFIGGLSNWTQNSGDTPGLKWSNTGSNCLGFNQAFIATKLKQQFILNFNWLIVLIIVVCLIILFLSQHNSEVKLRYLRQSSSGEIYGIVGGFVAFVLFSCLYITASIARYNVSGDVLLYLIMFYVLSLTTYRFRKHKICMSKYVGLVGYGLAAVLFLALLAQSFLTVDPLTKSTFLQLNSDSADFCYIGEYTDDSSIYYGDYLIYNTQFTYIDRAYDKLLAASDFDPSTYDIILTSENGAFMEGNNAIYYLNWDSKNKKRVYYTNEYTTPMNPSYLASDIIAGSVAKKSLKDHAILVSNSYWLYVDADAQAQSLQTYYDVSEAKTIKTAQGTVVYYELTKK